MRDTVSRGTDAPITNTPSDYERVGGAPAIRHVVQRFYELILADPQLAPFFEGVDMPRLKRHQVLLISQVLGGPAEYDGRDLHEAHAHLRIGSEDFGRVVTHLVAALREANVDDDIIDRVGNALAAHEKDVVTAGTP
jgi:hemoglobin